MNSQKQRRRDSLPLALQLNCALSTTGDSRQCRHRPSTEWIDGVILSVLSSWVVQAPAVAAPPAVARTPRNSASVSTSSWRASSESRSQRSPAPTQVVRQLSPIAPTIHEAEGGAAGGAGGGGGEGGGGRGGEDGGRLGGVAGGDATQWHVFPAVSQ